MILRDILAAGFTALSIACAGPASAAVIFSNIEGDFGAYTATRTLGMSFAPIQSGVLESIELPIYSGAKFDPQKPLEFPPRVPETGIVSLWTATLRTDNVWVKDAQLEQWDITVFKTSFDPVTVLSSAVHPSLEADERYWVFLDNVSWVTGIYWGWDTTPSGTIFDSFDINNQYNPPGTPWNSQFGLTVNAISAIPEPATWATMIVGFGFVGFMLRRGRQRDLLAVTS